MECLAAKDKIQETFKEVSELSMQKNPEILKQEDVNSLLDKIIEFQNYIEDKTSRINYVNSKFKELSWFDNVNQECLILLKELLTVSDQLHSKMIRYYVSLNWALKKGIANESMKNFKIALDDLKEYNQDLEDLFFAIPLDKEFAERIKRLSE